MYGVSQFVGILSALVFVVSADAYRTRPRIPGTTCTCCCRSFIWFALAPILLERRPSTHRGT